MEKWHCGKNHNGDQSKSKKNPPESRSALQISTIILGSRCYTNQLDTTFKSQIIIFFIHYKMLIPQYFPSTVTRMLIFCFSRYLCYSIWFLFNIRSLNEVQNTILAFFTTPYYFWSIILLVLLQLDCGVILMPKSLWSNGITNIKII